MKKLLFPAVLLATVATAPNLRADAVVVFNEIMYHPATNEPAMEWIELRNLLAVDVDISDWSLAGGIQYTFQSNTIVKGRGQIVIAISPSALTAATGATNVLGPFTGRLSNNGDTLRLRNNSGRLMDEVNYGVSGAWPVAPDGSGVSLAKRDPDSASEPAASWTASAQIGGTPGAANFATATGFVAPPGLVSYWNFNEASGTSALDQAGQNHGTLGGGVTRVASTVGSGLSFNSTSNAYVNAGVGANNNFAVSNGLTIEGVLLPNWSGSGTSVFFRKAPVRPTNYVGAVLANNPIAYWRLNDSTTTITDATANARNGTATAGVLRNQPSLIPTDPANGAVRATGSDRITIPGFEKIGAAGYTVEFWVKVNALPTACCQNLVGDGESANDFFMMNYILGPQQGQVGSIRPHYGTANSPVSLDSPTALQVNGTYHVVTTWDTSIANNNAAIYINGAADRIGTVSRNVPAPGTTGANPVYIGLDNRDVANGNYTYDEVALYNRPLSGAEVAAHYFAATATNFDTNQGNAIQLAFQNDGNNAQANPPVAAGPALSFGLTVNGVYSELDMPLDGQAGRPTLAQLQNGQPHHIAAAYDSASGLKGIYIDGTLRFSTTLSGLVSANNLANAVIGNAEVNGAAPYNGALDEMAYWGRALSAAEAAAHSSAVQAGRDYFSTTGQVAAVSIAFNEVSASTNAEFWLELMNYGSSTVALDGFVIVRDGSVNSEYVFPTGRSIAAGGYLAITNTTLGFKPVDGDKLFLLPPARDKVIDAIVLTKGPRARSPEGTGTYFRPSASTPGAANSVTFRSEIVINEIMYGPHLLPGTNGLPPRSSPEEWIELYNRSATAIDLTGWELDGGIQYVFTPGQTIPAGGYLVVANDVPFLKVLYPGVNIVGDYGGRLSAGDRVVLEDPAGNPADEVRFFGGGNWPEYAFGGGSSLELRDPNSDNAKAEAWAASDETGKSSWQTYTYRMVANIPSGSGQPTMWQDFILGLQSAGECLIDDLSVIESPTNAPIQFISNGDFSGGLSGWRVLGTHNRSRVEPEPGNPGNNVLHLVATGPQEHMHNHIERTLNAGRTIANGREYEISFRARWLAGNNFLNTRLYFNRSPRTTVLPIPTLNGTPGAQNSRFAVNVGPTFSKFGHQRVVPAAGEAVTVSVVAEDPQGVASAQLFWSVNSGAWASAPMTGSGGGLYAGTIPGQGAGAVVQFYVQAADGLGTSATYPARGTNSGALYKVNDGQANLALAHNVRIILTPANIDLLHGTAQGVNQTNVMSNDLLPCTVIYDETRAYYDCGVHLRGSQRGRYSDIRTGFHINFPPDNLFRGVHPVMLIDRSGAGDATANRQEEIVLKHILNRAGGIPGTHSEICHLLSPRAAHVGPAQFFPRHEDLFIESAFENGGDGPMFEMELIYYPTSTNAFGYKNPQPDNVVGTDITDLGPDKEIYRYNHMLKNHRDEDDYRAFIALSKAWSLTGAALDTQTRQLMDIDEWMRAYALVSLCSVGDMYTFGNNHNFFIYQRPSDGKFLYFPWDMDFAFTGGASRAPVGTDAVNLPKIINLTANLRCLYAHMIDIINISFNTNYMAYWTDHYDNFAPGQNYATSLSTIAGRVPFIRNTITSAGGFAPFAVTGNNFIVATNNLVTLVGTAPVLVKTIIINGKEYPVTWTSISGWRVSVPVSEATNVLNIVGYDVRGNPLTNFTRIVTVNYTGPTPPDPEGVIVFNEIMYNPLAPDASFVELFNTSNQSFDLSGWRINGLDFAFPPGSIITNRQYLVIAKSMPGYATAYGTNTPPALATYGGQLQNDGELLTLLRPGPNPGDEIVVDQVRYEAAAPWPAAPNGTGPSLQLIDANQDNARVSDWDAGAGWQLVSRTTANIGNATNIILWLNTAGNCFVDDVSLVGPEGTNILGNGGFEAGIAPWIPGSTYASSVVVEGISHSGTRSLFLNGTSAGGTLPNNVIQNTNLTTALVTNVPYTLSFYALFNTNSVIVNARTLLGNTLTMNIATAPIISTPGTANTFAGTLPSYDPLWLNEVQPENTTGITDNNGEREPWIELFNAGVNAIDMSGYYLANNYSSNLTQWQFPAGASIAPGEFKLVWADGEPGETSGANLHTSFRLAAGAGTLALLRLADGKPQITDYLSYTNVTPGRTYGDYPNGQPFFRQEFFVVTPRAANDNSVAPIVAHINEWMAANTQTLLNTNNGNRYDDWFELYNPGPATVSLAGHFLTDNLSNKTQFAIPPNYTIPANGYLLVWADGRPDLNTNTDPALHVNFRLDNNGEAIGLFAGGGARVDSVEFEPQFDDYSQGKFPNGTGPIYFLQTATPRAPNSSWANRYPVLNPIPNFDVSVGESVNFVASASDPDAPPQVLTFSLDDGAPVGAVIDPVTGAFQWMPPGPSTNFVGVRVTDNGAPRLSAAQYIRIAAIAGIRVSGITQTMPGQIALSFGTTVGKTYRVEYKTQLTDPQWTILPGSEQVAVTTSRTVTDNTTGQPQRFYRIVKVD